MKLAVVPGKPQRKTVSWVGDGITPEVLGRVVELTGVLPVEVIGTLTWSWVPDLSPLVPDEFDPDRVPSFHTFWLSRRTTRRCWACWRELGGVDLVRWQFRASFVCARHGRWLSERCGECGKEFPTLWDRSRGNLSGKGCPHTAPEPARLLRGRLRGLLRTQAEIDEAWVSALAARPAPFLSGLRAGAARAAAAPKHRLTSAQAPVEEAAEWWGLRFDAVDVGSVAGSAVAFDLAWRELSGRPPPHAPVVSRSVPAVLRPKDVAALFAVSPNGVKVWIEERGLKAEKRGSQWVIRRSDLRAFVRFTSGQALTVGDMLGPWYSPVGAATRTGHSPSAVTGAVRAGRLRAVRVGATIRIREADLDEWAKERPVRGPQPVDAVAGYLPVREAVERFGVSKSVLGAAARAGRLPSVQFNGWRYVSTAAIAAYVRTGSWPPPPSGTN